MPSGVMYDNAVPVIGNGVVVDPERAYQGDGHARRPRDISCKNLKISCDAHIIMPYHKDFDGADEKRLGENKIGTTKRGIGPCYQDKAARKGIRVQDLLDEKIFRLKLEAVLAQKNPVLEKIYGLHTYTVDEICEEYLPYARILKPYMAETAQLLNEAVREGKSILFEGAQGTLLDIDHGTYPYVTSLVVLRRRRRARVRAWVSTAIDRVLGIQKAYITRVGGGPFPDRAAFSRRRRRGRGSRGRRASVQGGPRVRRDHGAQAPLWLVRRRHRALRCRGQRPYRRGAHRSSTCCRAFDTIKVCTAYECEGKVYDYFPMQQSVLFHAKPVYEELPGWKGVDITECRTFEELPENAQRYVEYLEEITGVPISIIAVGPDRDQTIMRGWDR